MWFKWVGVALAFLSWQLPALAQEPGERPVPPGEKVALEFAANSNANRCHWAAVVKAARLKSSAHKILEVSRGAASTGRESWERQESSNP